MLCQMTRLICPFIRTIRWRQIVNRFPVTLYKEQWTKLLAMTDEIRAFIKEHDAELKAKPEA